MSNKSSGQRRSKLRAQPRASRDTEKCKPPLVTMPSLAETRNIPIKLKSLKRREIDDSFEIFSHRRGYDHAEFIDDEDDDGDADGETATLADSQVHDGTRGGDEATSTPDTALTERTGDGAAMYDWQGGGGRTDLSATGRMVEEDRNEDDTVLAATMPARTLSRITSNMSHRPLSMQDISHSLPHAATTSASPQKGAKLRTTKPPWMPCALSLCVGPGFSHVTDTRSEQTTSSTRLHSGTKFVHRRSSDENIKSASLHTSGSLGVTTSSITKIGSEHAMDKEDDVDSSAAAGTILSRSKSSSEVNADDIRTQLNQMIKNLREFKLSSTNVHLSSDLSYAAYESNLSNGST